jgi:hypothetical protein
MHILKDFVDKNLLQYSSVVVTSSESIFTCIRILLINHG